MHSKATTLNKASGILFVAGFIIGRLRILPFPHLVPAFNLISLLTYLGGYTTWYVATQYYPNTLRDSKAWYGFAEFKHQHQIASLLGILATFICILFPVFLVPALWIYAASNILWTFAEYHKYKNPALHDSLFLNARHEAYLNYTYLVTLNSLITAGASTLIFCYPALTATLLFSTTIAGLCLTLLALGYLYQSTYSEDVPENKIIGHSYATLSSSLDFSLEKSPAPQTLQTANAHPGAQTSTPPAEFHPKPEDEPNYLACAKFC